MTAYQDTLNSLYSQLPMYQRLGAPAFKKGLENTRMLLRSVGDPHLKIPCIHIAGTNGKGTVAHMIAACLTAAGFRTGLYVSPHYQDFRERMKVDGKLIPSRMVVEIVQQMRTAIEEVRPSFFEMTVAMAFAAFERQGVGIAVIETGLGGRLDSTNVVSPLVSVITNISFDHMSMLGNTLPKIAREKAGIIKRDTPVVIGEFQTGVASVFRKTAQKQRASISFADRKLQAVMTKETWETQTYDITNRRGAPIFRALCIGCAGPFQQANLITALHALEVLGKTDPRFALRERQIRTGLRHIRDLSGYQGRWQVLGKQPLILCDSAHNAAGLSLTLRALTKHRFRQRHFVLGFVNDKELDPVLSLFPSDAQYYFCRPDIPRGLDVRELRAVAELYGLKGRAYRSVRGALRAAKQYAGRHDLVFVGGSTFVVAEVL